MRPEAPRLGVRANWQQFVLLVIVNAFVGAMVGVERAVLPLLADREFRLTSRTVILSFILCFGLAKAFTNVGAGRLADRVGRKALLVIGWVVGLPVPFLLLFSAHWSGVLVANALLGVNQGLCWSLTVIMKIDLAGPGRRGLAMGLNEAAGYGALAVAALGSGSMAAAFGARQALFVLSLACAAAGLALSAAFVRETADHAAFEARLNGAPSHDQKQSVFARASWGDRTLFACSQAGLVNNLNDGMAWGLFPLLFAARGLSIDRVAALAALYPAVWAVTQLLTGVLSDRYGRRTFVAGGMAVQAAGIWTIAAATGTLGWGSGQLLLGLGTAMVYPALLAAVSDASHPAWRASAVGVYRLWRDLGYAIGAVLAGALADALGIRPAIVFVGALTAASAFVVLGAMRETARSMASAPIRVREPGRASF